MATRLLQFGQLLVLLILFTIPVIAQSKSVTCDTFEEQAPEGWRDVGLYYLRPDDVTGEEINTVNQNDSEYEDHLLKIIRSAAKWRFQIGDDKYYKVSADLMRIRTADAAHSAYATHSPLTKIHRSCIEYCDTRLIAVQVCSLGQLASMVQKSLFSFSRLGTPH